MTPTDLRSRLSELDLDKTVYFLEPYDEGEVLNVCGLGVMGEADPEYPEFPALY